MIRGRGRGFTLTGIGLTARDEDSQPVVGLQPYPSCGDVVLTSRQLSPCERTHARR